MGEARRIVDELQNRGTGGPGDRLKKGAVLRKEERLLKTSTEKWGVPGSQRGKKNCIRVQEGFAVCLKNSKKIKHGGPLGWEKKKPSLRPKIGLSTGVSNER